MTDLRQSVTAGRSVSFGPSVHDDAELRVCGDVKGKRILELGLFGTIPNCVTVSLQGARSVSVDPSPEAIRRARQAATNTGTVVEFHESELADLGFIMSGTIDVALCVHQITLETDIARLFRQVHRVLRPEAGFVLALTHPMSAVFDQNDPVARRRYGTTTHTIGDIAIALQRAGFAIDIVHELSPVSTPHAVAPTVLVIRARKLGS